MRNFVQLTWPSIVLQSLKRLLSVIRIHTGQIDENNSQWGDTCSFYYYYPVIELAAAVLWIVLLAISGPRHNDTGL